MSQRLRMCARDAWASEASQRAKFGKRPFPPEGRNKFSQEFTRQQGQSETETELAEQNSQDLVDHVIVF
jgi:hypothetical protein